VVESRTEGTPRLLLAIALASGITSVPHAAIVLALPTIHHQFNASLTDLEWTVTGYLPAYSALLIAAGRLADVFGRMRVLRLGTVIYMAASVPAALAQSPPVLIAGLIGAGVGAAVLTPGIARDRHRGVSGRTPRNGGRRVGSGERRLLGHRSGDRRARCSGSARSCWP
jgi:predicted MFS family arabinose efflux permease